MGRRRLNRCLGTDCEAVQIMGACSNNRHVPTEANSGKSWFVLHLPTCIVLQFVAGLLILGNIFPPFRSSISDEIAYTRYGLVPYYLTYWYSGGKWHPDGGSLVLAVTANVAFGAFCLLIAAVLSECIVRRFFSCRTLSEKGKVTGKGENGR